MKRVSVTIAVALGAVFGLPSCDDEESDSDKVARIVEDLTRENNESLDIQCDCYEALGYESASDCKTMNGEILPARQRCIEDALAQDADATEQWADCQLPLAAEFTACIDSKLECDDFNGTIEPCNSDLQTGQMECIELPNSVNRDYMDCFPSGE